MDRGGEVASPPFHLRGNFIKLISSSLRMVALLRVRSARDSRRWLMLDKAVELVIKCYHNG